MRSATARLMLLVLFVAALAATGYYIWASETTMRAAADTSGRFDDGVVAAARGVLELRAAQQAYVAAGQGEQFWTDRVAAALSDLKASIAGVRAHVNSPRAETAVDSALTILQDFEEADKRAREYVRSGERLIASDLIFSDGLEMTGAMLAALDEARTAERQDHQMSSSHIRRAEVLALASCAVLALLVIGLLVPVREEPRPASPAMPTASLSSHPSGSDALDLALDRDGDKWTGDSRPSTAAAPPAVEPASLDALASLCTDLARVADTRSLPSILERTATALDASGVVLWIADSDGRELAPIVAHGYSPQVLSRLGTIACDAQNVTGDAFRTGLVQTVKADATSNGAIAAPLMTPSGAVGVMAAEVRLQGEQQPAKLAAASIIAAQLATLVGPPVARVPSKEIAGA